jgi:hypothetical protein
MAKPVCIELKVHPALYDFYFFVYKSDTITLSSNSCFYQKVIAALQVKPADYKTCKFKKFGVIKLFFPYDTRFGGKHIYIGAKEISDRNQELISRELYYLFKDIFHNYVLAYCRALKNVPGCQKKGILDFCESYQIKEDTLNYDMLEKSWKRSEQRKMLNIVK